MIPDARTTNVFIPAEGGPVFLSEVECTGIETSITECPSVGLQHHSCSPQNGTGVICGRGGKMHCNSVLKYIRVHFAGRKFFITAQ